MKSLFALVLFIPWFSLSQELSFNGEAVDSIYILSHQSAYQFDEEGTIIGKENGISISFDKKKNNYFIEEYLSQEYVKKIKTKSVELETKNLTKKVKREVDSENINFLLNALNTNIRPDNLIDQLDTNEFCSYVTRKQILKTAKKLGVKWYFNTRRYTTKEKNQMFFSSCISIDTLNTFLLENFDTKGYAMVTDFASTFDLWITTSESKYWYEAKYPNTFKQPWYDHSDTSNIFPEIILNLDINKALTRILPSDFFLINTISENTLFESYIRWYFARRGVVY